MFTYAATAWFSFLTKENVFKVEKVQKFALEIILPDCNLYEERLGTLSPDTVENTIYDQTMALFE